MNKIFTYLELLWHWRISFAGADKKCYADYRKRLHNQLQ